MKSYGQGNAFPALLALLYVFSGILIWLVY
jgi:hypothetical protein